jgi:alkanesulfonate monooxygenase SsuD/methylene tetrahydromethanopterin reductase-like flavin-dependent oxidoreductase (luciferase family)
MPGLLTAPFDRGSISVGLSAVGDTATQIVARLGADANAAVAAGFDGVTLSEHHGGFPGYVSSPLALAAGLLGRMDRGWAVAAPAILPLRNPLSVAEDLAWSAALHPGRVAAGFVAGYQRRDFELLGVDFSTRHATFWRRLQDIAAAFAEGSPLDPDPAVRGARGLPLLAGVGGPIGARRAARCGVGMIITSLQSIADARGLVEGYEEVGGIGPAVLIRRVHVGGSSSGGLAASMADWRSEAGSSAEWLTANGDALITGHPESVVDQLSEAVSKSGCSALNLRIDAYNSQPELVADQMDALGSAVLPTVRSAVAG